MTLQFAPYPPFMSFELHFTVPIDLINTFLTKTSFAEVTVIQLKAILTLPIDHLLPQYKLNTFH